MKGQITFLNFVAILVTLMILAFVAGLFYPILEQVLLPNFSEGDMNWNLAVMIFPILMIILVVIIWLWAKPIISG